MGVKGLWSLLNPVARPVQIESMEGKRLAIDSSIWLYQFQATMRDKDGRVLVNAHVLGFLRRINKLLFHGIKPVFVFDGGAPNLKRATIAERKKKKAGAAANHAKMAEKLFAAQMRREAVKVAQASRDKQAAKDAEESASRYPDEAGEQIAEGAVYLEDLESGFGPSRPRPPLQPSASSASSVPTPAAPPLDPAEERRKKFRKHDPYRLPEATMPTVSTAEKPDARLATEEELKQFIDEMHPEDIDVESPEFRALPTEVQYEIIGDLRVRSRQQSHRRLADMLRAAPTALDFSKAQIKHLSQRNALTQQLLTVTDMVGKAHLTIPIKIAAERNREYVLVKRGETEGGGWALGIREGTKANPIKVEDAKDSGSESETESESEYSDDGSVQHLPSPPKQPTVDPDLREHRRREILEAIAARYAPKAPARASLDIPVKSFGKKRKPDAMPLFETDVVDEPEDVVPTANDEALALALQQEELGSDEEQPDQDLARALALSRREADRAKDREQAISDDEQDSDDDMEEVHTGAASGSVDEDLQGHESDESLEEVSLAPTAEATPVILSENQTPIEVIDTDEDNIVEMPAPKRLDSSHVVNGDGALKRLDKALVEEQENHIKSGTTSATSMPAPPSPTAPQVKPSSSTTRMSSTSKAQQPESPVSKATTPAKPSSTVATPNIAGPSSHKKSLTSLPPPTSRTPPSTPPRTLKALANHGDSHLPDFHPETPEQRQRKAQQEAGVDLMPVELRSPHRRGAASLLAFMDPADERDPLMDLQPTRELSRSVSTEQLEDTYEDEDDRDDDERDEDEDDDEPIEWSRSPSPTIHRQRPPLNPEESTESIPFEAEEDGAGMDRADMVAEEDDYARFMAQIKNRNLDEVRGEIDDEIRILHNQAKVSLRDSDEISAAMVAQIQTLLRHFGIPYITAPMEAEAQCAKLAELNLVDGVITDDSDVFLFGGKQCFKNIFNDSKYAECFLLTDIDRELSLTRERLISLAYLLGSDYTIGLPGVGPVVALELLANFPGETGISDFKAWWMKVQRGQDTEEETNTKWKASFKKRYSSSIYLTADWPNLLVREAYKYPTTDESEEPFHWGFPKLSALRAFLHEELSWSISKVDDELTPIVQRIARRGKLGALNKQGTLDSFFDMSVVSGNYAPRRRTTANVSKRLMSVIKAYREAEAKVKGIEAGWGDMMQDLDEDDPKGRGTGSRAKSRAVTEPADEVDESGEKAEPVKRKRAPRATKRKSTDGDGEGEEGEKPKRKRTTKRKATISSVADSERGTEPPEGSASGEGSKDNDDKDDDDDADYDSEGEIVTKTGNAQWAKNMPGGRGGKGKKKVTRRIGPRWDVVTKPSD